MTPQEEQAMSAALSNDSVTTMSSRSETSYSAFRGMAVGVVLCSPIWIAFGLLLHRMI